jgi:hypothetical protein
MNKPKYNPSLRVAGWYVKIMHDDAKRVAGKEAETGRRLSHVLLSDRLLDDGFCKNVLPKIIDQYASLVELYSP